VDALCKTTLFSDMPASVPYRRQGSRLPPTPRGRYDTLVSGIPNFLLCALAMYEIGFRCGPAPRLVIRLVTRLVIRLVIRLVLRLVLRLVIRLVTRLVIRLVIRLVTRLVTRSVLHACSFPLRSHRHHPAAHAPTRQADRDPPGLWRPRVPLARGSQHVQADRGAPRLGL
jgi:hypothetical protein